jgi:hypothetical protein
MVMMMMRRENVGQRPAATGQGIQYRLLLGRIDGGRPAAFGIVDQHAEIIAARAEKFDFELGHGPVAPCFSLWSKM